MDAVVIAALITLMGTLITALIAGIFYLWRRDPGAQMNGVLERVIQATQNNADAIGQLVKSTKDDHAAMRQETRELANVLAPRQPRRGAE